MTSLYSAGLWDLRDAPAALPAGIDAFVPGAHVAVAHHPHDTDLAGIALRRSNFEIRDTLIWMHADGHTAVTLARTPLTGTIVENVLAHGAGGLNIDACRIPIGDADKAASEAKNAHTKFGTGPRDNHIYGKDARDAVDWSGDAGRFPTNVVLQHDATCVPVGTTTTRGDARASTHQPGSRPGGFVNVGADKGDGKPNARLYPAAEVLVFDCSPACPVRELDARSGERRAGVFPPARGKSVASNIGIEGPTVGGYRLIGDVGGASRYFPRFTDTAQVWQWVERLITPAGASVSRFSQGQ